MARKDKKKIELPGLAEGQTCMAIKPPKSLQRKAITPSDGFAHVQNAINRAEKALEELSENFGEWMAEEAAALSSARDDIREQGVNEENIEALFLRAHDIRGQAETLGFPFAAKVCDSLCNLIEAMPNKARIPQIIIDHHVDSVRAIVRENVTTKDDLTAGALIDRLRSVSDDFVDQEVKIAKAK